MVKNIQELRKLNLESTRKAIAEGFSRDVLIIQTSHTLRELDEIINRLVANLRERYGYYAPRIARDGTNEELLNSLKNPVKDEMGIKLSVEDLKSINELGKEIENITHLKAEQEKYLDKLMDDVCPELKKAATSIIGAQLLAIAGSLRHLAELPSSTIQVLGAEKALFRHIKTGAKPPRFGVIFAHPSIANAKETEKGKTARKLASKISIAVKMDYFKVK